MTRYIAFLRAINVGGHTVKMDALKDLFTGMGFTDVATYIASGNVIFTAEGAARSLEQHIEATLADSLGYEVVTFLRRDDELAKIAQTDPFADEDLSGKHTVQIGFLRKAPPKATVVKVRDLAGERDRLEIVGGELYWLIRGGFMDSKLGGAALEKVVGPTTLRNLNTVRKIAAKYPPEVA